MVFQFWECFFAFGNAVDRVFKLKYAVENRKER